ncbi:hypothetical protein GEMRC1_002105 [Eukaryota sp. GEM-RC1]
MTIDEGFNESQQAQSSVFQEIVDEHSEEIAKINEALVGISTMFKDMATLIVDQGSLVDQIDFNLDLAERDVESAVGHLENAAERQRKKKMNYCILLPGNCGVYFDYCLF